MTTQAIHTTISREAVEALSALHNEPEWLRKRRLDAWRLFEEAPMPDPLDAEWKRIDVTELTLDGIAPIAPQHQAVDGPAGFPDALRPIWDDREELAGRLVQLDADVVYRELDAAIAQQGVLLTDLHSAARDHEQIVRDHLESAVTPAEWKYLGLHGALWSGGALVYVPDGVEVALPIEYAAGMTAAGAGLFPHLLIVAGANSKVTVVQESMSPDLEGKSVVAGAVEVIAGEGAQVGFIDVQRWGSNVQNFVTMRAHLAKDASFEPILLGLGGAITKSRLDVVMDHEGARANLLGLFVGNEHQVFDYDTRQDHIAPRTESDLLFKAALTDSASLTWNGVVDVRETASQAAANQTSRNLLLSDKASAAPTPILEISAFDVARCSHGATVGPVDREQIFYLQARGIPHDEAEKMLVEGFFAEVLERVPSERLQERVRNVLQSKIKVGS